jgi:hypothetical protein
MQCFKERESENIKEKRKIYAARDFSDKYDFALFKYPVSSTLPKPNPKPGFFQKTQPKPT